MAFGPSPFVFALQNPALAALTDAFGANPLTWVLAGIGAYWLGLLALEKRDILPEYVGTQGPIITVHTKRGRALLDRLAAPKRFWRAWSNLGVGVALVVMGAMFLFLLTAAYSVLQAPDPTVASEVREPRNVLVIPGVNDFLPLSAAPAIVLGLLIGLVVHEGGHGLLCRVEDIDIESMGVALLAVLPVGAFVEPDHESSEAASRGGQTRMFAAGVTNNLAITVLAFALLFGPVAGAIGVASGAAVGGVAPDSPAADAGIQPDDRITAVGGEPVESNDDLQERLDAADGETVDLEIDGEETVPVDRAVLVAATPADGGPGDFSEGDRIVAVEGEPVATESAFRDAVGDQQVVSVTVQSADGEQVERELPVGALVLVAEDGPLSAAGPAAESQLVITSIDGERVHDAEALTSYLQGTDPGDEVVVEGVSDGEPVEYEVTLDEHPQTGTGFLGIVGHAGVSGLALNDLGVELYPTAEYLSAVGGDVESSFAIADSFLGKIGLVLFLPFAAVTGLLPYNFAGFLGGIENFYQAEGALAAVGDPVVFALANALFWTGWINIQLAFFNCIPAFPLDGGHILRTSTEAVLSRLPIDATRGMVRTVTTTVGLTMLLSVVLMFVGPQLLGG